MTTQAQFDSLISDLGVYREAIEIVRSPIRAYVNMLNLAGVYHLPQDIAKRVDDLIAAIYDAAIKGYPIPDVKIGVIYGLHNGQIVIVQLRRAA